MAKGERGRGSQGRQAVSHSLNSSSASFNPKVDIGIIVFLAKGNREIRTRLLLLQ